MRKKNPRNVLEIILITIAVIFVVAVLKYMDNLHEYTSTIQTFVLQPNGNSIGDLNGLLQ
ncbi:hypothetical protein KKD70_00435 [Patescibacteria group bacterium]|nr:hypothetical protein [Patescibacteria group bacterium]